MGKPEENKELKIQNIIAFNQRKKQAMLREMIQMHKQGKTAKMSDTSRHRASHNQHFKNEPETFKSIIGKRIDKNKERNLKNINKIQMKSKRI